MNGRRNEEISVAKKRERRKILVVGNGDLFTEDVVNYTVHLAERLDYDILALNVCTWCNSKDQADEPRVRDAFIRRSAKSAKLLKSKAARKGIECGYTVKFGDLGSAVVEVNHEVKRIELVVMSSEAGREEVARVVTVPLFSVVSNTLNEKGGKLMADQTVTQKGKPIGKTIGFGLLTVALYAALFANSGTVMHYFTMGGAYAALPIATVFVFSFAHGAFASNLWSLMGIEAMKKDALRQTEKKVVQQRKTAQKKPRAYAYINPFHRM